MDIRFGPFQLDLAGHQLLRDGQRVHLPPKVYHLLCVLAEERPRALSRQELHARLWPGALVSDVNLACLVAELRTALGDWRRLVRTVHGFGYAFEGTETPAPGTRHEPPIAIAILPAQVLDADPVTASAAAELTDELITRLGATPGFAVLSLSAARAIAAEPLDLPRLARDRHVAYVVETSVRRDAAGIRVNVRLIDAPSSRTAWSERLLAAPGELADLQASLAGALVDAVHAARANGPRVDAAPSPGAGEADEEVAVGHA